MNLTNISSILFDDLAGAVAFARDHGGWICKSDKLIQWFDASKWTPTKIVNATSNHGEREIGTYPMFLDDNAHQFVDEHKEHLCQKP